MRPACRARIESGCEREVQSGRLNQLEQARNQCRHLPADLSNHFRRWPGANLLQLPHQGAAHDDTVGDFAQVLDMFRLSDAEADAQRQRRLCA